MAVLVVIGGPNGSGKTSLTFYLQKKGRINSTVINPDDIALNELGSYRHHLKAARIALERRAGAISKQLDIAFETTFSGNSEIREVQNARRIGYQTVLYFVALKSKTDNIIRVEERRTASGHTVDRDDILRRYDKSQANLFQYLNLFDRAYLFDNSGAKRSRVAIFNRGELVWLNSKHRQHPFYKDLF